MARRDFRIGLLAGYMSLFDEVMGPGFRQDRHAWAERMRDVVAGLGDVVFPGSVASFDDSGRIKQVFRDREVDVILAAPTMASPPGYSWSIVEGLPGIPIIVWNAHALGSMPDSWDARDIVRHSANVGTVMLTNTLLRNGRAFHLVTGRPEDPATQTRLHELLEAARAVARLRHARLAVIGDPIEGYDDVVVDADALERDIGPRLVRISKEQLLRSVRSVPGSRIEALAADVKQRYRVGPIDSAGYRASVRLAAALESLCDEHGLDGGAINCRTDLFAYDPEVASIGCFAISHLTTNGRPFACTGDVVTAVAMLLTKALGGEAFYHECDMIDYGAGLMWLGNTGESDFNLADPARPVSVIASEGHSGQLLPGASTFMHLRPGPGTIVGFSPNKTARGGWSLVWAEGEILGTRHVYCRVPNGEFRFKNGPPDEVFNRWCRGGATHHASLSSGHLGTRLQAVADMLGIGAYSA